MINNSDSIQFILKVELIVILFTVNPLKCYCADNQWIVSSPNKWGKILDGKCAEPRSVYGKPLYYCDYTKNSNEGNYIHQLFITIDLQLINFQIYSFIF
jgi:hypothetical protein